ncbi:MAG TPA: esterase, partial [Aliiroseovarius sp.]|nr:esterase [Aliiroseovarius sp.]
LAGDSAGANLASAVSHATRGQFRIAGQVLIYGAFGGNVDRGSYLTHAHAPMLTRDDIVYYMDIRFDNSAPDADPTAAPLQDTDFTDLPPSVLISAECDPLSDDSRDYAERIESAGGQALWINEAGLVHGYLRGRKTVRRARESFARIVKAIDGFGRALPFPPSL